MANARMLLGDKIAYAADEYSAAQNADALVILTEWPQFAAVDLAKLAQLMNHKILLDFRNMLDGQKAVDLGFYYQCVGKKY
jgi:UDPglucose 6-dehydrogenase